MNARRTVEAGCVSLGLLVCGAGPLLAGAHTWNVNEVFSNADGTVQFIELVEPDLTLRGLRIAATELGIVDRS